MLTRIFPFIVWFKDYDFPKFKIDFIAGLTVALVLIPQSMAYAQLAGLPAYYGLYASFLPPMTASLFGSSRQLATGPVAIVSLMTAATLAPLATAGSEAFIAYAILLAFTVGVFQMTLGILKLGLVVNFLSHPVVNGFTNAAAIIIASSQLPKFFGIYVDNAPHNYETIMRIIKAAMIYTHWPTLTIGVVAVIIMAGLKRINPRIPYVLVAVVITTLISYFIGFENTAFISIDRIANPQVKELINDFNQTSTQLKALGINRTKLNKTLESIKSGPDPLKADILKAEYEIAHISLQMEKLKREAYLLRKDLRNLKFYTPAPPQKTSTPFYTESQMPPDMETDGNIWHIKVGSEPLDPTALKVYGGGNVVGDIPKGLPELSMPDIDIGLFFKFLPFAMVISILGFVEAIAIAKAMAAKTGQRLDPDQELIGQGLANIVGSFGQSYPVSGSFSRSAVNLQSGAVSGLSSVITSVTVIITLLFFTPFLYHLPQAVLAAVIMMAVIGLVNVSGFIHAWRAKWYDGAISIITFISTLILAPHVDRGIYIGVALSLGVFLFNVMRPKVSSLSRDTDQGLRAFDARGLKKCKHIDLVRFEGPLFFANASYLEDEINDRIMYGKDLNHIIIASNAINDIDASGEEALALIIDRLRSAGYGISFSGVNETVMEVFKRTHLLENIGEHNIYPTMEKAIAAVHSSAHQNSTEKECPLLTVCKAAEEDIIKGEE